jgi:hypothetical protein
METNNIFIVWTYLVIISLVLIPFRTDGYLVVADIRKLLFSSLLGFVITSIMMFLFLPFFLIDTIQNITRK